MRIEFSECSYKNAMLYTIPAIGVAAIVIMGSAGAAYGANKAHDYQYPHDPVNQDLYPKCLAAIKAGAYVYAATFPASCLATAVFSIRQGLAERAERWRNAAQVWKESIAKKHFLKAEGIMINTILSIAILPAVAWKIYKERPCRNPNVEHNRRG